jgi:hypothetical protein
MRKLIIITLILLSVVGLGVSPRAPSKTLLEDGIVITESDSVWDFQGQPITYDGTGATITINAPRVKVLNLKLFAPLASHGVRFLDSVDSMLENAQIRTDGIGVGIEQETGSSLYNTIRDTRVTGGTRASGSVGFKFIGSRVNENQIYSSRSSGQEVGFWFEDGYFNKGWGLRAEGNGVGIWDRAVTTSYDGVYFENNGTDLDISTSIRLRMVNTNKEVSPVANSEGGYTHEPAVYDSGGIHFMSKKRQVVLSGSTTFTYQFPPKVQFLTDTYIVLIQPHWNTTAWISNRGTVNFTVSFSNPPSSDSTMSILFIPSRR